MTGLVNKIFSILLVILSFGSYSQRVDPRINYLDYINKYKDIAIKKMHEYRIPASITLAQGILESGCGTSPLTVDANNHFGIKCHKEWTGMTYTYDDDEKGECFRKYASAEESFNDHSLFLTTRPRYANLFSLDIKDYKGWAYGLKAAGYATNPKYAEMLIRVIEENELYLYDSGQVQKVTIAENSVINTPQNKVINKEAPVVNYGFEYIEIANGNRSIYQNNGVKLIISREGDNAQKIADDVGVHTFQILQYNELGRSEKIKIGSIIYIEPKKKKSNIEYHIVKENENMRDIAQRYAIKLNALYKKNGITEGHEPVPGTTIHLRGMAK
ncbi:MAG TPA: glucosaminidase domain-containing protein [Lentimicrobium sp.]|nr:glucosaminidase domain-containing protein [Lentimicrobium sp.]